MFGVSAHLQLLPHHSSPMYAISKVDLATHNFFDGEDDTAGLGDDNSIVDSVA